MSIESAKQVLRLALEVLRANGCQGHRIPGQVMTIENLILEQLCRPSGTSAYPQQQSKQRVTGYRVVEGRGDELLAFENEVNALQARGWALAGGVSIATSHTLDRLIFAQAMQILDPAQVMRS